jgi:NADH-quinone oxidoreductase subunit J
MIETTAQGLIFYLFAGILTAAGAMVIASRNPVHSVLFLILAFFNAAGLFVLLGAEFVALILVIVYVGAVAVLFLFVVMMLDVNFRELRRGFQVYLPFGATVGLIFLVELVLIAASWVAAPHFARTGPAAATAVPLDISNTKALGELIYTHYALLFQASGVILLIAMIGAIVLTLRHRPDVRRQNSGVQINRRREDVISVQTVTSGKGV